MITIANSTKPTPKEAQASEYRDANAALFHRRAELHSEIAETTRLADEIGTPERITARRLRTLRRLLDDVTAEIVQCNIGLVRSYTRRFVAAASPDDRAEFEAAGMLGLMRAIDSYDPECGAFGQWAFKPIQREVLRAVRDTDHPNLNLGDFEKRPAILRALRQLQGVDESYSPSEAEVAAAAGVTVAQVRRVLAAPKLTSIYQPTDDEDADLGDSIRSRDLDTEGHVISKLTLAALEQFGLTALDQRELYVIVRRFGLDGEPVDKLADIGGTLDLSREAVRQIEAKALAKLQHPIVMRKLNRLSENDHQPAYV